MSDHYEVVFSCFLKHGTPDEILAGLRWHLGISDDRPELPASEAHDFQRLSPDPDSRHAGGEFADLRRHVPTSHWSLFSRNFWHDDEIGWIFEVIEYIAPFIAEHGYGGFFRLEHEVKPVVFGFADGSYGITERTWGAPFWIG